MAPLKASLLCVLCRGGQLLGNKRKSISEKAQVKGAKTNTPSQGVGGWKIPDAEASLHHQDLTKELQRREGEKKMSSQAVCLLPRSQQEMFS